MKKILKDNLLAIIGFAVIGLWSFVSETFKSGLDNKYKESVFVVLKSEKGTQIIDSRINLLIDSTKNDNYTWLDVLANSHIGNFAEVKAAEVRKEIKKELLKKDSISLNVIDLFSKAFGVRNENLFEYLEDMDDKLKSIRTVNGNF